VAGRTEETFVIDVGLSGAFVERKAPLNVGDGVEIRFCLPENEIPITARCRVAWWHDERAPAQSKALPAGAGLEFTEIAPEDQQRLRDYLSDYYRREPNSRRFVRHGG
jgi:hypothetical protein